MKKANKKARLNQNKIVIKQRTKDYNLGENQKEESSSEELSRITEK